MVPCRIPEIIKIIGSQENKVNGELMEQKSVGTNYLWTNQLSIKGLSDSIMFEGFTIGISFK